VNYLLIIILKQTVIEFWFDLLCVFIWNTRFFSLLFLDRKFSNLCYISVSCFYH